MYQFSWLHDEGKFEAETARAQLREMTLAPGSGLFLVDLVLALAVVQPCCRSGGGSGFIEGRAVWLSLLRPGTSAGPARPVRSLWQFLRGGS